MTRSKIRPTTLTMLLAAVLLSAAAVPASAVAIKHTNRVGGDPDAIAAPSGHAAPPADTTTAHALDKAHESGSTR